MRIRGRSITRALRGLPYILWALAVLAGMVWMMDFENAPSEAIQASAHWPSEVPFFLETGKMTLVLFAHPQCPCTKASISELSRLMTHSQGKIRAHVYLFEPTQAPTDWKPTSLGEDAAKIPDVTVLKDIDGRIARSFGATTSGQTLLYDGEGNLLFQGGITSARGRQGDNAGRSAITSLVLKGRSDVDRTPVFGCRLFASKAVVL